MSETNSVTSASSATGSFVQAESSRASEVVFFGRDSFPPAGAPTKKLVDAVYAHIRALRALGQTRISTADIADALSLNRRDVESAISVLKDKGVRVIK